MTLLLKALNWAYTRVFHNQMPLHASIERGGCMANVSDLHTVLSDIRRRLLERHAFIYGDGVGVDDPEYVKEQQIFEDLQARLSMAIKARQKSRSANNPGTDKDDELLKLAEQLQTELRTLAAKNQAVNPIEGAAELWDNAHEYHESLSELRTEIGGKHGEITAPPGPSYTQSVEAAVLWVFVLVQGYRQYMKRRKK